MVLSIIFGDESNQNKKIGGCIFSELCFLQKNSVTFALQPSQDHFFLHTCMVKNIQSQPGGVGHGLIPAGMFRCAVTFFVPKCKKIIYIKLKFSKPD